MYNRFNQITFQINLERKIRRGRLRKNPSTHPPPLPCVRARNGVIATALDMVKATALTANKNLAIRDLLSK